MVQRLNVCASVRLLTCVSMCLCLCECFSNCVWLHASVCVCVRVFLLLCWIKYAFVFVSLNVCFIFMCAGLSKCFFHNVCVSVHLNTTPSAFLPLLLLQLIPVHSPSSLCSFSLTASSSPTPLHRQWTLTKLPIVVVCLYVLNVCVYIFCLCVYKCILWGCLCACACVCMHVCWTMTNP